MSQFKLLSVDTHVEHPPEVWAEYVPERCRQYLGVTSTGVTPHAPLTGIGGLHLNVVGGLGYFHDVDYGRHDPCVEKIPGAYGDANQYLEWLDMDGVQAGVIIPGVEMGPPFGRALAAGDTEGYLAMVQGINNWLSDFCRTKPDRLLGCAFVPQTGIEDALAELRRVRKLPGICTIGPAVFPNGSARPRPEDDQYWQETLDLDMPVTIHGGLPFPPQQDWTGFDFAVYLMARVDTTPPGPRTVGQMILSGLFDRLPTLRFIMPETAAGFVPFLMDQMDNNYYRHKYWAGMDIKMPPSEYCRAGHFLWNIIVDAPAIKYRYDIGVDNLSWSSDFPHSATDWPRSQWHCENMLQGVPAEEKHKILWSNAAEFYRLEPLPERWRTPSATGVATGVAAGG